tara:strand:+ start:662 stop:1732 length:1071 start_codon:yes stop_codon:yes gene_type:complete
MKVCILGDGLTSLALAKALVNKGISTDVFFGKNVKKKDKSRTLGISNSNLKFFNKYISNVEKFVWDIDKIEIYSENLNNKKIIDFNNKKRLFSIIKNHELNSYLVSQLKKSKFFRFKKSLDNYEIIKKRYQLIINCDPNNEITKKFFYKNLKKDYKSFAYTTIIEHKKIMKNNVATQTFTKKGPIAFLPISNKETSVVYSIVGDRKIEIADSIRKFNIKYKINKINKISCFKLQSSNLRSYYYKNILAFGDLLHRIHPLAGQGFNMSIRDIKSLIKIIEYKNSLGLNLDSSICEEFENKNKHTNYIFSNGIDFVYEFFNSKNNINNNLTTKFVKFIANSKISNKFFTKLADEGIVI